MINFCDLIKQQPLWFDYRMLDNLLKNHVKMWRNNTVRSANLSDFLAHRPVPYSNRPPIVLKIFKPYRRYFLEATDVFFRKTVLTIYR